MADNSTPNIVWGPPPTTAVPAAPKIVWGSSPSAPPAPQPGMLTSIGAGAGRGFGESMLGVQQLVGKALSTSIRPSVASAGDWLQKNAAQGLTNLPQEEAPYQAAHPFAAGAGEIGGQAGAALTPEGLLDVAAPGLNILKPAATWLGRAGQAARTGLVSGAEQPVYGPDYWKQKAEETAANVAGSMGFGQIGEVPRVISGIRKFASRYSPQAVSHHALKTIVSAIEEGEASGHVKAKDIIDFFNTTHAAGVPTTLMEAGGHPLQSLAGVAARTPGAPSATIRGSFESRTGIDKITKEGKPRSRLLASIKRNFDAPHTRREVEAALSESQKSSSTPLYEKAFKPSSIVSISKQFKKPFDDVTKQIKDAKKSSDLADQRFKDAEKKFKKSPKLLKTEELNEMEGARADAAEAKKQLTDLQKQKDSILSQLRVAQQGEASGIRGAVYSPHIAYMMEDPKIKAGLKTGLENLASESRGKNIPFDPNDYGVKINANGEPEIFATPNMRLLDAAKRGLDHIISQHRNPETGTLDETGRVYNILRKGWVDEIDRINPHYKSARDAFAGPAALKDAMFLGEKIMHTHHEDVKKWFNEMSESEKEHYRTGAAQAYSDTAGNLAVTDSELRKISQEDELADARRRLQPVFKTKAQLDDFMTSVTGERAIYNAEKAVTGGSQSAERIKADAAHGAQNALDLTTAAMHAKTGNFRDAGQKIANIFSRIDPAKSKAVQTEIARILSNPDTQLSQVPGKVLDIPEMPVPPPGKFTSAARMAEPIIQALGAQSGNWLENQISGQ